MGEGELMGVIDMLSYERIARMSRLATIELGVPCILMIGAPTEKQIKAGFHYNNWRMHVYHKEKWWHLGGHIEKGVIKRWHGWSPDAGEWNRLGFKDENTRKIENIFLQAKAIGNAPRFLKYEKAFTDRPMLEDLMSRAQAELGNAVKEVG